MAAFIREHRAEYDEETIRRRLSLDGCSDKDIDAAFERASLVGTLAVAGKRPFWRAWWIGLLAGVLLAIANLAYKRMTNSPPAQPPAQPAPASSAG